MLGTFPAIKSNLVNSVVCCMSALYCNCLEIHNDKSVTGASATHANICSAILSILQYVHPSEMRYSICISSVSIYADDVSVCMHFHV